MRPVQDRVAVATTPTVLTTKRCEYNHFIDELLLAVALFAYRSVSVSSPPAVNGRLLHETGQTLDEPPYW